MTPAPDPEAEMDLKTAIAATPMLRKAWRVVPGPLKVPLLVAGGAYAVYYLVSGKGDQAEADAAAQDDLN